MSRLEADLRVLRVCRAFNGREVTSRAHEILDDPWASTFEKARKRRKRREAKKRKARLEHWKRA